MEGISQTGCAYNEWLFCVCVYNYCAKWKQITAYHSFVFQHTAQYSAAVLPRIGLRLLREVRDVSELLFQLCFTT